MFLKVAVNYPVKNDGLTYKASDDFVPVVGDIVVVPLGRRKELGCVTELNCSEPEEFKAKAIISLKDEYPRVDENNLKLYQWMASYYHYGLGQLIVDCLPASKKRPKPLVINKGEGQEIDFKATAKQSEIISKILNHQNKFSKHLIHGVTGSGKTHIYLELIKKTLLDKKSVLYLLPEINLTPQFLKTFTSYVDVPVFTFHSELSGSQKFLIWKDAAEAEEPRLYIGVRSSVFLPVKNLGLIIVDEEHDNSFKQEDRCTYNARDVAMKKAQIAGCPVVLGSATPAIEIWQHFNSGLPNTFYYPLEERVTNASLPEIVLVDTKTEKKTSQFQESVWPMHEKTIAQLKEAIEKKEQALVFINRLGFANYVQCRSCGHQFTCKNCSTTLRFFKAKNILSCQHCEYHEPFPQGCPKCGNLTLLQKGFGTERVLEELQKQLPEARIERFDRDEIKTFKDLQIKLDNFHSGEIDILVGTQMLSKGHNFKRVKKVIILGVDNQLNLPDFRATEKVWQTIVQVAGRAGRYSHDGKVFVQTANPDSNLFEIIKSHSFDGFYKSEMQMRKLCECPPFFKLSTLYFSSKDQDKLASYIHSTVTPLLHSLREKHFNGIHILGPRPSLVEKRANQYSWTVLLKSNDINQLHNMLNSFSLNLNVISGVSVKTDVDPQHIS
ncbi:MAG: primosomal protein N' [Bacteriovoracaceae bacterium]|nr:primosomal protein N' [Bacteriovoracaceae bacterium]